MFLKRFLLYFLFFSLAVLSLLAQNAMDEPPAEPEAISIFPLGAQPGSNLEAELRGRSLDGAYAVWCDAEGLQADVKKVEEVGLNPPQDISNPADGSAKIRKGQRLVLNISIDPKAKTGLYSLRVVSPKGVSNTLPFLVVPDRVVGEAEAPHNIPAEAQGVGLPVVINGRIRNPRELDYYSFEAAQGQELAFEIFAIGKAVFHRGETATETLFQPQVSLYRPTGSWMDPDGPTPLRFREELASEHAAKNRWTNTIDKKGRYLVRIASMRGKASSDFVYQLRVVTADQPPIYQKWSSQRTAIAWQERVFPRKLDPDRLEALWSSGGEPTRTRTSQRGWIYCKWNPTRKPDWETSTPFELSIAYFFSTRDQQVPNRQSQESY
ncbi:MAG: hypothetical protein EXQ58_03900 [Acidobacteria bacterium]|nr:hypothetical protein [Acidobacteriota bacterium]